MLVALFRAVMSLVHHWAEGSVWNGSDEGYCRTRTVFIWEERYLPGFNPPCVGRSKYLDLSLCLIGIGTLAPGGVLVRAVLPGLSREGQYRGVDESHED